MLTVLGCADPLPEGPPKTLATHPRPLGRYMRLKLRELAAADPVAVHRELECELDRLFTAFGRNEGLLRMTIANDSIYRTPAARARYDSVQQQPYGKLFEGSGLFCDPLNAIADREDPIAPVDSAIRDYEVPMDSLVRHPRWERRQ